MSREKPCSKLQSFFLTEGERILKARLRTYGGQLIEKQIASAAADLRLPYLFCWRVHYHGCGARAFLKLHAADRALETRLTQADSAAEIAARLKRLELQIARLGDRLPSFAGEASASHGGDLPQLSFAL